VLVLVFNAMPFGCFSTFEKYEDHVCNRFQIQTLEEACQLLKVYEIIGYPVLAFGQYFDLLFSNKWRNHPPDFHCATYGVLVLLWSMMHALLSLHFDVVLLCTSLTAKSRVSD